MMDHELDVILRIVDPANADCEVLAEVNSEAFGSEAVDGVFQLAIARGKAGAEFESSGTHLEFQVRVWQGRWIRAALHLSSVTVERMASISASLNFDPKLVEGTPPKERDVDEETYPLHRPELVVKLIGDSPVTGKEMVLCRAESEWFEHGEIERRIREVLAIGMQKVHGDPGGWALEVGIRLGSDRGVWPAFNLPRDLISLLAACRCSLDFDPYV